MKSSKMAEFIALPAGCMGRMNPQEADPGVMMRQGRDTNLSFMVFFPRNPWVCEELLVRMSRGRFPM